MALPETPHDGPSPDSGESDLSPVLPRGFNARLRAVQARLWLERLWVESWAARAFALLFLAVLLSGLLPILSGWVHAGVLAGSVAGLVAFAFVMGRRLRWPDRAEAMRRWEGRTLHRPLTASFDRLSRGGDPLTDALWAAHKRQARHQAGQLRMAGSDPQIAARDPWGLRAVPVLALAVALTAAWSDPFRRLEEALTPALSLPGTEMTAEVWLTPPSYTGLPPLTRSITVQGAAVETNEAVRRWRDLFAAVPAGTRVQMVVRSDVTPSLRLGQTALAVEMLDQGVARWEGVVSAPTPTSAAGDGPVEFAVGSFWRTWLRWPMQVVADQPPSLAWTAPPTAPKTGAGPATGVGQAGPEGVLTLPVWGDDDWGFSSLMLDIRRADGLMETVPLPVSGSPRTVRSALSVGLANHPWAGLEAQIRVRGQDAAGQEAMTDWAALSLPERSFTHPVARRIMALRKTLITTVAGGLPPVAVGLSQLAKQPDAFGNDLVTFLSLRVAALRVAASTFAGGTAAERQGIAGLLWQTAVRVEDGRLAGAREVLEQARQALADAVAAKAPPEAVQAAIAAVRQAANAYINELLSRMEGDASLSQLSGLALSAESIDRMAETLDELTRLGSTEAAQQVMDQLSRALSRLQAATRGPDRQQMEAVRQMMAALKEVVRKQEELLQQTFTLRQDEPVRRKATPSRFASRGEELAGAQDALAGQVRELAGSLMAPPESADAAGGGPPSLAVAGTAMDAAAAALRAARWDDAQQAQGDALAALKKGQGEALATLLQGGGQPFLVMPGGAGLSDDPTGRGGDATGSDGQAIPDKPQRAKAWDLLQELRRRAGDRTRPDEERDYLNRLLKLF